MTRKKSNSYLISRTQFETKNKKRKNKNQTNYPTNHPTNQKPLKIKNNQDSTKPVKMISSRVMNYHDSELNEAFK